MAPALYCIHIVIKAANNYWLQHIHLLFYGLDYYPNLHILFHHDAVGNHDDAYHLKVKSWILLLIDAK